MRRWFPGTEQGRLATPGRARRTALLVLVVAGVSCGGGSPTTPDSQLPRTTGWATGTVVQVVSGDNEEPVSGARVTVAGDAYTTDREGRLVLRAPAAEGAEIDVEAEGCLFRETTVRGDSTRLTMWPDHSGLPGEYTRALVYTASTVHDSTGLVPLDRLPPGVGTLALTPSRTLAADPAAMAAHRQAVDYFNAAVQGRTVFSVEHEADMTVPTRIDSGDPSCEGMPGRLLARTWVSDHEVNRAEIVFCGQGPTHLAAAIAHEMGHIFGLAHSIAPRDVMFVFYTPRHELGFSEREALVMGLLHLRRGGNTWPDNDRTTATSSARVREFID